MFQMRFFPFFFRSVPDHLQIIPRLGGPLFQISRFLDFKKNLVRGTGTPFQILATISRFPDCSRFWNQIPTWLRQLLSERAEDAGNKKEKDSSSSLHCWSPLAAVALPVTTAVVVIVDHYPVVVVVAAAIAVAAIVVIVSAVIVAGRRCWCCVVIVAAVAAAAARCHRCRHHHLCRCSRRRRRHPRCRRHPRRLF